MKCLSIAIAIALVLAPSLAHAGKPTAKEAKAALAAWNAELHKVDSTKAADLAGAPAATSTPFQVAVFFSDGAGDKTCESTVTDKAKLGGVSVDGYHVFVGGGFGANQAVGRQVFNAIDFESLPPLIEKMLCGYLRHREAGETFYAFTARHDINTLQAIFSNDE